MDMEDISESSYVAQHFGFHSRTLFDKIYNVYQDSLLEALIQLKKHLIEEYKGQAKSIEVSTETLFKETIKKLDIAIDRLEVYLHCNIFKIDQHIILPEDEVHVTHPCTAEEDKILDKEIEDLREKILTERTRRIFLKAKIAEQKDIKEKLVVFENQLQHILAVVVQSRLTKEGLKVTMQKCCEILNELKEPKELE